MLSTTLERPTWLHRIAAGPKLVALAGASVVALRLTDPLAAVALAAGVVALYATCGRAAAARLADVRPIVPLVAVVLVAQGLLAGWGEGVAVAARILAMVWLANLVTLTTRMDDMLDALSVALSPLRLVGVRPRTVALAVALVVRFVPVLLAEWRSLADTWRARTGRRAGPALLAPFTLRMLDLSDRVGEALAARYAPSATARPARAHPREPA